MDKATQRHHPLRRAAVAAAALLACACSPAPMPPAKPEPAAAPAPPPPPAPEPEPEPVDEGPPEIDQSRCAQDLERELPVAEGEIGSGPRVVRVINNGTVELRARLVGSDGQAVLDGTLRVPAGAAGTFKVGPGSYRVRYRVESNCHVFEGSPVHLTGPRSGVEIGLKALFEEGSSHKVRRIDGDL